MKKRTRLPGLAAAVALTVAVAGCGQGLFGPAHSAASDGHIMLTEHATASALVAVPAASGASGQLFQIIGATARPLEHLDIIAAGSGTQTLIASQAPAPATVWVPAGPVPPPRGATSYQEAVYQRERTQWDTEFAAGQRAVRTRTAQATTAWVQPLLVRAGRARTGRLDDPATTSLAAECALAANVLAGIMDQAGARFGGRVVVLAADSLGGMPSPGELSGDDVLVITPFLPSAAAAAAAQQNLLAAGAARAAVLGPEATPAELDQLVADGLSTRELTETVSGPALFANDSAVLLPPAARVLAPLLAELQRPGVTAVINGYASSPGTVQHNQRLSENRAVAVAGFFESRGVSSSALFAVGHGASDFVAVGSSGDNRRVVVVIEEPAGNA